MGKYDIDLSDYKCQFCGLYFKGYDIDSHEMACHSNPNNQQDDG
jgi:hypothetical protein